MKTDPPDSAKTPDPRPWSSRIFNTLRAMIGDSVASPPQASRAPFAPKQFPPRPAITQFSEAMQEAEPHYAIYAAAQRIAIDVEKDEEHLERLSPEARLVYLLCSFDAEIHNGGFDQMFFNSTGDHALEILESLKVVGAWKCEQLLAKALSRFPDSRPAAGREQRCDQLDLLDESAREQAWNALDSEFYLYEDGLSSRVDAYVKNNRQALVAAGACKQ